MSYIASKRDFLALSAGLSGDVDVDWQLEVPDLRALLMRSKSIRAGRFLSLRDGVADKKISTNAIE